MSNAESYEHYRPNYPTSLLTKLVDSNALRKEDLVAEFGCGTGKLTDLLLNNGNYIFGVEPNKEMYKFLSNKYLENKNIKLINKASEKSSLHDNMIDVIVAAQSFHMFDVIKSKKEFYRILKPNGTIILVWYHWDMNYSISSKIRNLFYKYGESEKQQKRVQINDRFIEDLFYPNLVVSENIGTMNQKFLKNDFIKSMLTSSYATLISNPIKLKEYATEVSILFEDFSKDGYIEYTFNLIAYHSKISNK